MIDAYLAEHLARYPRMTAQDAVKLLFQARCGCGHLLADEDAVAERAAREMSPLPPDPSQPLLEPIGDAYARLNLRRARADGLTPRQIARAMLLSEALSGIKTDRTSVLEDVLRIQREEVPFDVEELRTLARRLIDDPAWLPSHSEPYRQAYAPAYRVVSRSLANALTVVISMNRLPTPALVCIDGPCASGKTTLAKQLVRLTDAACVPMDDFYLPHAQKTPERLALPGGNADIARLNTEVLRPWRARKPIHYRPYLCGEDAFGPPVAVPDRPLLLLEGSYSLHPAVSVHAGLEVFLTVDPAVQRERLLTREGPAGLDAFLTRWIPLEAAYHRAFALPEGRFARLRKPCLILRG